MYQLMNTLFPTNVGINAFITIMLLALTTTCDGGALLTTQGTHISLILSFILRGGRVAFISPNMRRDMVPWSIRRVTDWPPNAKMHEMQQNTHGLVQLIRAAPAVSGVWAESPLPSPGSPHGDKIRSGHLTGAFSGALNWAEWLHQSIWPHHPCLLRVPMKGRNQYGYITPAFSGSQGGEKQYGYINEAKSMD